MEYFTAANIVDAAAILLILGGALLGLRRGLSGEIVGLFCTLAAFAVSFIFLGENTGWLREHSKVDERTAVDLAFFGVFIGLWVITFLPRILLRNVMKVMFDPPALERTGGLIAGLVKSTLFIFILFISLGLARHDSVRTLFSETSRVGRWLEPCRPYVEKRAGAIGIRKTLDEAATTDYDEKLEP
jgi:uncharacterized membrane protein required for colicin V production